MTWRILNDSGEGNSFLPTALGGVTRSNDSFVMGYGDEFPPFLKPNGSPGTPPANSLFFRIDLGTLYRWDTTALAWVSTEAGLSVLTTRGDILGRNSTTNARIPGPPTTFNANGWPYILRGGMDLSTMADWGLPWEPEVVKPGLVNNTVTDIMYLAAPVTSGAGAAVKYLVYADDNTNAQQESGLVFVSCIRDSAGTFTTQVAKEAKTALASAGTLVVTFTIANDAGNNRAIVQVNANTSLVPTDLSIIMSLDDLSDTELTFPFGL